MHSPRPPHPPHPPQPADADFVTVAQFDTPTEAHLVVGMLQAAGVAAHVVDAHLLQANAWMATAVGGVRVQVAAAQAAHAQEALAAYRAGAYALDDTPAPAAARAQPPAPLYSPDGAVLWSFLLTPVFGATVQWVNARRMGTREGAWGRAWWLGALAAATALGIAVVHRMAPGPGVVFRASWALAALTVVWYFAAGQAQSRACLAAYGPRFATRPLLPAAVATASAAWALGWAWETLGR